MALNLLRAGTAARVAGAPVSSGRRRAARLMALAGVAAATVAAGLVPEQAVVGFDAKGVTSLRYGATEFLASGDLQVNGVTFRTAAGGTSRGDLKATVTVDQAAKQVTRTFSWGSVAARYRATAGRVDVQVIVTNRSPLTLQGIALEPLSIRLPAPPREYDGVTPMMAYDPGEPGLVPLHYPTGTVVLASENAGAPLLIGFPWSSNRPANTVYPVRVHTEPDPSYPTIYPRVVRPIAPGRSDEFTFSLRFGPAGADVATLASDVFTKFTRTFPPQLKWRDRRPIGQLVLATTALGSATNPRGWLLDPKIDVTTPAGLAAFRKAIGAWADQSVRILKELDAQGMIVWDIEGEQFTQPTTYLCDPRVLPQAAPEMEAIADSFFLKFRNAGLRVGVCVRPQKLVLSGSSASQQTVADPTQLLIDKIAYAKARWGASLFYVDSNGDPNLPIDAGIFRKVLAAHPDVLLVPEHENTRYHAYSAPYRELRQGHTGTPLSASLLYPDAFSTINVSDGDFGRYGDAANRAVQRGDALLTRAWYPDPAHLRIKSIYQRTTRRGGSR